MSSSRDEKANAISDSSSSSSSSRRSSGAEPVGSVSSPDTGSDERDARLVRSAGVVSFGVMTSRVLGLVREMVLAYLFRTGAGLDAFYAAFRIPNLLRDMFGEGVLSKAFVSTFTEEQEREGDEAALRLANLVANAVVVAVGCLTLLGILFAEPIVDLMFFGEGFDGPLPAGTSFGFADKRALTVYLTRIMFPFILLVSMAALAMGLLNARRKFFIPAMASSFFNLGSLIVGITGYFAAPRFGQHPTVGMAVGVVAGGVFQLLWQIPSLIKEGYRYKFTFSFRDPKLLKVVRLFGPGALAAASVQVNVFINSIFASMGSGWLSWINLSFRLVHLPIGLIGVAVSAVTLPALSRAVTAGDKHEFRETFSYSIRLVILFTVPAMVGLIVLAEPIVGLIYERGQFTSHDTEQVAAALVFFSFGLLSYALVKIVTDGFYAIQDLRAPLIVSLLGMVLNAGLNYFFIAVVGMDHRGLALSTSCTVTLSFALLWFLLRRRSGMKRLGGRAAAIMLGKMIVASAGMGIAAVWTSRFIENGLGNATTAARLLQVGASILVAIIVLYVLCRLLKVRELDRALQALKPAGFVWR